MVRLSDIPRCYWFILECSTNFSSFCFMLLTFITVTRHFGTVSDPVPLNEMALLLTTTIVKVVKCGFLRIDPDWNHCIL
jgi:hypothetical protein